MEPLTNILIRTNQTVSRLLGLLALLIVSGFVVMPSYSQETRLIATVEFVAGQNLYLNVGLADGITDSDSLMAYRNNRPLGLLRILGVTESRTVVTYAGTPFPITRGNELTVAILAGARADAPVAEVPADTTSDEPERQSVFEGGRTGAQLPPVKEGIRVTGRLSLSLDLNTTQTSGLSSLFERDRTYTIPVINLRTSVEHLPGNLRFNINSRFANRSNESRLGISPENSLRIYQLNLEYAPTTSLFEARLGRFFNPYETFSGYWDGLGLFYAPDSGLGAGVLGGFQPTRANEDFTNELPKYTAFGTYAYRNDDGTARYNANVSFHQVFPDSPELSTHTFIGFAHTLNVNQFRIRNLVQIDQDPIDDSFTLSRFQAYGIIPVTKSFSLRARYLLRKPYNIFLTENFFGYQRERVSGGFSVRTFTGIFSADVSMNTSEVTDRSYAYNGYATLPRTNFFDLGFSAMVNYWRRDDSADVLYIVPSISRYFGRSMAQVQYHYQSSNFDVIESTNHTVEGVITFPIGNRIRSSIRLQSRFGDFNNTFRIYTTLWTRI